MSGCQSLNKPAIEGNFPLKEKWHFEAEDEIVAEPGVGGGKVVIRTGRKVYALDATTGTLLWDDLTSGSTSMPTSPALVDGQIVVVGYPGGIKALDAATGKVLWTSPETKCSGLGSFPTALSKTMVYEVRPHCSVKAYSRTTGAVIWDVALPGGRSGANLFLNHNKLYVVTNTDILLVLDSMEGDLLEEIKEQIGQPATYQSGILYGFKGTDQLVAFDVQAKKVLWHQRGLSQSYPPLLDGQRLLVPTDGGQPMAFDTQTGQLLWEAKTGQDIYQTPVVLNNVVYILGIGHGKVYALSVQDGTELGHILTGGKILIVGNASSSWRPVVAKGLLIVPIGKKVYAYGN